MDNEVPNDEFTAIIDTGVALKPKHFLRSESTRSRSNTFTSAKGILSEAKPKKVLS